MGNFRNIIAQTVALMIPRTRIKTCAKASELSGSGVSIANCERIDNGEDLALMLVWSYFYGITGKERETDELY
ncbi:MAG: hypothetical protein RR232_08280 [Clostridia bacterium]